MKAAPFSYARATSVAEACDWLRRDGDDVKLIAGGQSLVPMMAMRLTRPRRLIDINEIAALKFIALEPGVARIGACTRQCVIERDDALAEKVPLLRQALEWVGHTQTRNRGTGGGSLAHADPAAELPLVAQVLGATLTLRSATGTRNVNAGEFLTGPLMTAMKPDECLEEIRWPAWPDPPSGSAFIEVSRRHGDFAMVAAAAQVALDGDERCARASFGIGGGGPVPRAFPEIAARLVGTKLEEGAVRDAAEAAAADVEFSGDLHASAEYRRHLAGTLAARALRAARDSVRSKN
ncbi:MAG TPA: FAD binding domain-containing protein [Burkholderiales bacterium]|nr:FAD binding domain-containing protein [Burkholderiales bacterium]